MANFITFLGTLLLLTTSLLSARQWRSLDGLKSFEASYLSNDGKSVTMRKGGNIVTFKISMLHQDDQLWLKENHPPKKAGQSGKQAPVPEGAAFDRLLFGDSRGEVIKKLKSSKTVTSSVEEIMLARVGLNGTYKTTQSIGGLHCHLFFDWNENQLLKEVTLRTTPKKSSFYAGSMKSCWSELIELLTTLHGKPLQGAPYPSRDELSPGQILGSHLWKTEEGHSVLLGTSQDGENYSVVVRFTTERIEARPVVEQED